MTTSRALVAAYSSAAGSWTDGPTRIYGRLAGELVAASPVSLRGALVADLGAGTGAGSRVATAAGARVVAVDAALGMLRVDQDRRPPAVTADLRALPFRPHTFDVVLAPFSLNHLAEPAAGVAEAARVLCRGGVLLASTYARDDDHPAKAAVDRALREAGWEPPGWYLEVKAAMAAWGTAELAGAAIERGGLTTLFVERRDVAFPELRPRQLVDWRLGMAHTAPFVSTLGPRRAAVVSRSLALLGARPEVLIRRVLLIGAG